MLSVKFSRAFFVTILLLLIIPTISYERPKLPGEFLEIIIDSTSLPKTPEIQLNKQASQFVQLYIRQNTETLEMVGSKSTNTFNMIDSVFREYDLPVGLKYLAVIESELNPKATSRVGAVGPWQFMPGTAKVLGLKISRKYDERTNFKKSTKAAAIYLRDLYSTYGDWLLVIAAYNCGPAPVNSSIRKSGSRNFWKLQYFLPAETRKHVKKFIATHYYFEGTGSVVTHTKPEYAKYLKQLEEFSRLQESNKAKEIIVADIDTTTLNKKVILN